MDKIIYAIKRLFDICIFTLSRFVLKIQFFKQIPHKLKKKLNRICYNLSDKNFILQSCLHFFLLYALFLAWQIKTSTFVSHCKERRQKIYHCKKFSRKNPKYTSNTFKKKPYKRWLYCYTPPPLAVSGIMTLVVESQQKKILV